MKNARFLQAVMTSVMPIGAATGARWHATRRAVPALLMVVSLASGCGKQTATGPAPGDPLPPWVVETFPVARATRVPFETAVWARFREPLDSTTVSGTTVFLKIDTRRIPMTVSLEDSARKIVLRPRGALELRRTHTIEFSPRVRTAAGASFNQTYFWQFTTLSVRQPLHPEPAAGATFESPVAPLFWDATEVGAGPVEYRLFHGPDSVQVEAEATGPMVLEGAAHLPTTLWQRGSTVFWKVRTRNRETGDEAVGPVWRFEVVPNGAVLDSILVPTRDSGYWDDQFKVWRCPNPTSGARAAGIVRFDPARVDSGLVVAGATILLPTNTNVTLLHNPLLFSLVNDQAPCDARFQGFPKLLSALAGGVFDASGRVTFSSVLLAAQVQARIRGHQELHDYSLRSQLTINYRNPVEVGSGLRISYFRPAAATGSRRR